MTGDITDLLRDWSRGEGEAAERLFPLIYDQLRSMAARHLRGQRPDHTLQPTALVHEAYCRLVEQKDWGWENRRHFYSIAATMMRRILVDHARKHGSAKRGGGMARVELDEGALAAWDRAPDLVELDEALGRLETLDSQKRLIVDLRFFVGLGLEETAEVLGMSVASVSRHWLSARAWLFRELARASDP